MNPAFPEGYSEWRKVEPRELIDASSDQGAGPEERPQGAAQAGQGRRLGRDRDRLRPRGRADRARGARGDPRRRTRSSPRTARRQRRGVKRARYSALTKEEIEEAFTNLVELSEPLARAGEARQDIDLIWGATLTRFVSLATGRLGSQFLSVGRVQSPTLAIVVERELERRAHVPKPYWEVFATFEHPDGAVHRAPQGGQVLGGGARRRPRSRARRAPGVVKSVESQAQHAPAADAVQHDRVHERRVVGRRVAGARDADRRGPLHGRVHLLSAHGQHRLPEVAAGARAAADRSRRCRAFKEAAPIAERDKLEPTRGKKETTDHPPIYPTQALDPSVLPDDGHRKIYELVVRRFLATFADPSVSESTRADIEAGTETYFVRGNVLVEPGFLAVYPYGALQGRGDPEARGGPGAGARRAEHERCRTAPRTRPQCRTNPWFDAQGDPAAVAHRPGQADRDDGGARPRHEGDAPRHHPEALRPRLRPGQPDRALARPASRW